MHVLFIPSWYPLNNSDLNGCFFREQAHALSRSGHKIGVIVPQFRSLRKGIRAILNTYKTQFWLDEDIATYFKHDVFLFPKVPYMDLRRWVKNGLELFELYVKEQGLPEVIHVQSMVLSGPLALEIYKKYKIPYCITEHSSTFARNLIPAWQYKQLKPVIKNSSYCMAVSKSLCTLLKERFPGSQWEFIPNSLDTIFIENYGGSTPINDTQFCAIANLNKNKAIDKLILAFSNLLKTMPLYTLVIAGDGPEREKLEKLAHDLGIQQSITFLGQVNRAQVRRLMSESFCFVLSSYVETFGIVVIEALSQGTPVVATKCGGPESILTIHDGLLVDNSIEGLYEGMRQIIKNRFLYDRDDIRDRCIKRFSEEAFVRKLSRVYQHCINQSL